ncbi:MULTISPECIES: iron-sulfur cluster assembly protein [Rhodococcus]|uniref:iron-sulfur cluster assembly protein n=1 Tax=Rhodococcus TaxID=1827 RepID=UPI00080634E3|nr:MULTISPECIES: iron-sulfur cluster assembly protein [Rhodococcus]ANQ73249.1 metal-sulfur cluster biosynthetic enzyme [Rhodococcus sp. 008]MCZ4543749.1 iron-sulfur cluster assembly protein [Rhodococcus qingshengii]OKA09159.1 metal-sulfur cluster biosynthetic enzyme [Rhodococcus erythropolis]UGQ53298.1 iron-sulfur cluster assembly protein [Rhodococcus qingshengii]
MSTLTLCSTVDVIAALATVADPELDEPITDLEFVRSVELNDDGVEVHLRLPTAFCSPNFAYLMASDAVDALRTIEGIGRIRVLLDDHHDSEKINAGLAADAGYRGTFGSEADESLDELRETFQRKAHIAAVERSIAAHLARTGEGIDRIPTLTLRDLRNEKHTMALLRRRIAIGLSICPNSRVFVDEGGKSIPHEEIPLKLRFARSVRISIEGNAHFCRGLLATRYSTTEPAGPVPHITDTRTRRP